MFGNIFHFVWMFQRTIKTILLLIIQFITQFAASRTLFAITCIAIGMFSAFQAWNPSIDSTKYWRSSNAFAYHKSNSVSCFKCIEEGSAFDKQIAELAIKRLASSMEILVGLNRSDLIAVKNWKWTFDGLEKMKPKIGLSVLLCLFVVTNGRWQVCVWTAMSVWGKFNLIKRKSFGSEKSSWKPKKNCENHKKSSGRWQSTKPNKVIDELMLHISRRKATIRN